MQQPEAAELERLEVVWYQIISSLHFRWDAERVFLAVHPGGEWSEYWEGALGDECHHADDEDWLRGFVQGALEIWEQVKHKI